MKQFAIICILLIPLKLFTQTTGKITDKRDGRAYQTVKIGNYWWMAENLNYGTRIDGSKNQTSNGIIEKYCYDNLESNCSAHGGLYQWDEMMNYTTFPVNQGICPAGWHVPSDEEWKELEIFLGMSEADANLTGFRGTDQGTQLKSGGSSGFNASLDGYMTTPNNFLNGGAGNCFWTATDIYARYLLNSRTDVYRWNTPLKTYGLSLRCMMDDPFTVTSSGLPQVRNSITKWSDYDNDGDMDLFLCGITTYPSGVSDIYRNNGNGTFTALGKTIERISGSADWGDFDCDGDADLLISGYYTSFYITRLYRNDGSGVFTNYTIDLPGGFLVKWGDYDSDGDPDILLNQDDGNIEIYENKGTGTYQRTDIYFEKVETEFISLNLSSFDWGDYNNDGFPDIVVAGKDNINNEYCKIYKNNGNKTFTDLELVLRGASNGRVNWGDFDNDNDLDILLTGDYDDIQVYKNEGNDVFSYFSTDLVDDQIINSWLDFNNDGNLDVLLAGYTDSRIYAGNGKGSFKYLPCPITNAGLSDIDIADYDNDGDLDFVYSGYSSSNPYTQLYRNNTTVVNQTPQVPTGLTARQIGADIVFSWNSASDSENGKNLFYNITAGTSSVNCLIISPLSNLANGKRLKLNRGNVGTDTTWVLKNAPVGTLYWSVQSIDQTLKSSAFATFRSFEVKPPFSGTSISVQLSDKHVSGNSFIDINNDGLLDILTSCSNTSGMIPTKEVFCFINQGNNTFSSGTVSGSKLAGKFIPCNLNGDSCMDALLCGYDYIPTGVGHEYETVLKIYSLINNKSDGFNVSTGDFVNINARAVATGDFDNDGDDDIVFIGYKTDTLGTYLFKKENTAYFVTDLGFQFDRQNQAISVLDIDNDQDLDIVYGKSILLNDSVFIRIDAFPYKDVSSMDWGDFDGDGDMDAALYGQDTIDNYIARIYENHGNLNFSPLKVKIQAFSGNGYIRWLDFNNDGLLDLTASGSVAGANLFIYINQGNYSFKESAFPGYHVFDWGDFDNDNDLDFLSDEMVYFSNGDWNNYPPQAPPNLTYKLDKFDVILSWDKATDIDNSNGLSYNLKVGSSKDSYNVMQVLTAADGQLRIPRIGNVQANNGWRLENLPLGEYYWSVQAVDQSFKGGEWATEKTFTISQVSGNFKNDTVCEGFPTSFTDLSVTTTGTINAWKWHFGDGDSSLLQNPTHLFKHAGSFTVSLTAYAGEFKHIKTQTVLVRYKPHPDFTANTVCEGNKTTFTNISNIDSIAVDAWLWRFGDGDISDVQGNIQHPYLAPGSYNAQLKISATNGCSDSLTKEVIVGSIPNAKIGLDYGFPELCMGDSTRLSVEYNMNYHYQWKTGGINLTKDTLNYLVIKDKGDFSADVTNRFGNCLASSDAVNIVMLESPPSLTITANKDTNICQGEKVYLEVPYDPLYSYNWKYNGLILSDARSSSYNAEKEGSYTVDVSYGTCKTTSHSKQIVFKPGLPQPRLLTFGSALWYFVCDIENAKTYRWYYNGIMVASNDRNVYFAGTQLGEYYVEVNDGGECFVPSEKITIPLISTNLTHFKEEHQLYLYPNPASENIRILYSDQYTGKIVVRISNMEGKILNELELYKKNINFSEEINLSGLKAGLYFLEFHTNQYRLKEKLIIMK
jgi:uncharacterized protein (TIGR02145 family)